MIDVALLLENAHLVWMDTVDGLSTTDWDRAPFDGTGTIRDMLAHLTTVECLLVELVQSKPQASPLLELYCADRSRFNAQSVQRYADWTLCALFDEYEQAHNRLLANLVGQALSAPTPHRSLRRYGATVADCLIAVGYGHKLVHAAQIGAARRYRTTNGSRSACPQRTLSPLNSLTN